MKNSLKHIGIIICVLFVILLLFATSGDSNKINWQPTFGAKDKIPFGTFVLYEELKKESYFELSEPKNLEYFLDDHFSSQDSNEIETLTPIFEYRKNLILIEERSYFSESVNEKLIEFVKEGNTVLFSSSWIPVHLLDTTEEHFTSLSSLMNDTVRMRVGENEELLYSKGRQFQQFSDNNLANATYGYSLGSDSLWKPNVLQFKIGMGELIIHSFPYSFTNYYMLDSNLAYRNHVESLVNGLPKQQTIWAKSYRNRPKIKSEHELSVLLSKPALNYAWKLLIIGLVLYTLFKVKREQRIIPEILPLANNSKEFIEVVSRVQLKEQDFNGLSQKKYIYILDYLRQHYYIDINMSGSELSALLEAKTPLNKPKSKTFAKYLERLKNKDNFEEHEFRIFCKLSDQIEK